MKPACHYCTAAALLDDLPAAIAALLGCRNCRVDIQQRGNWNGNGLATLRALAGKHGGEAVIAAWEGAGETKKAGKKRKGVPR
jgi:hypothetical protein